jgi:hypothetical protein
MTIGSHIIPKSHLGRFANPPNRRKGEPHLWVYEKGQEPDYRAISVQGYENGYFAVVKPDGTVDEGLESRLAELEGACIDTLELTASPFFDLSASRRNALAFYTANLFCRAKQRRNRSQDTYANLHGQFVELAADDDWIAETTMKYVERHHEPITPVAVKERLLHLAELMNGPTALRNNFVEDLISATDILKGVLLKKPLQLWHAPDGLEFVTSDNPVVSFIRLENGRLNSGHGFRKPETIGAFPICPYVCLAFGASGPESMTIEPELVGEVNRTLIELCEKYAYSKTRSEEIRQMVDQGAHSRKYGVNAFVPLGLQIPTAKDFVLHMMRLGPWPLPSWIANN